MIWRTGVLFVSTICASAQTRPEISGVWEMNMAKSTSAVPTTVIWIMAEQTPAVLNVTGRSFTGDKEEKYSFKYALGSEESSNNLHGARMISHLAWEGRTLVITSLAMYGSQPLHMLERWTVDGDTLTIKIMTQFDKEPERNSVRIFERRSASQWPSENNKPAEEVYKNIQAFKGLPASSITEVMTQFTRDLGVICAYCHVGAEMEKDDKLTKRTARQMIDMTNRINSRDFGGKSLVTCGTCHHGSAKPMK